MRTSASGISLFKEHIQHELQDIVHEDYVCLVIRVTRILVKPVTNPRQSHVLELQSKSRKFFLPPPPPPELSIIYLNSSCWKRETGV
jgi:hypothetical protein